MRNTNEMEVIFDSCSANERFPLASKNFGKSTILAIIISYSNGFLQKSISLKSQTIHKKYKI